jgi:hypothetical protein
MNNIFQLGSLLYLNWRQWFAYFVLVLLTILKINGVFKKIWVKKRPKLKHFEHLIFVKSFKKYLTPSISHVHKFIQKRSKNSLNEENFPRIPQSCKILMNGILTIQNSEKINLQKYHVYFVKYHPESINVGFKFEWNLF